MRFGRQMKAGLVCLTLVASLAGMRPVRAEVPFSDLVGHWSSAEVAALAQTNIFKGYPDGTFQPDRTISRAEFYTLLARVLKLEPAAGPLLAPVLPADHWAVPVANVLAARGIIRSEEKLDLNGAIPRGEMADLITRAYGWPSHPENAFLTDLGENGASISAAVAHGIFAGYPDRTFRPWKSTTRAEAAVVVMRLLEPGRRPAVWREAYAVDVGDAVVELNVVRVNLKNPQVKPRVALAGDRVGATEELVGIVERTGAVAAINGAYFQAYDTSIPMESYGTVFTGGKMLQTGWYRAGIGFWADGTVRIGKVHSSIDGLGAKGQWWGSHGLNRYAKPDFGDDWAVVYTPEHGTSTGLTEGTSVVVRGGVVTEITTENVPIPADGFLVHLHGAETAKAGTVFQVGQPASFVTHYDKYWDGVQELLQVGPELVKDGQKFIDFEGEHFWEQKITTWVYNRSAVAVTKDGTLLLIQTPAATVDDLADALVALGVDAALCMDSGGSSGLIVQGVQIATPGRRIANALVIELK